MAATAPKANTSRKRTKLTTPASEAKKALRRAGGALFAGALPVAGGGDGGGNTAAPDHAAVATSMTAVLR